MGKKSFILYSDQRELFSKLSNEQAGMLIKCIFDFNAGDTDDHADPIIDLLFTQIKAGLTRDAEKWEETRAQRALSGKLGGLAKASNAKQSLAKASNAKQSLAKASNAKQNLANLAVNVNANVNGNVSVNANEVQKNESTKEKIDKFKEWPGVPNERHFEDWMDSRKKKKAAFTQTAFNGLGKRLTAGVNMGLDFDDMVLFAAEKGYAGFNVEWYLNENPEKRQSITRSAGEFSRPDPGGNKKQPEIVGEVECPQDM